MVLLPGSSISTSAAKEIEAVSGNRDRQHHQQDSDLESNLGTPPPPYRLPLPGIDYQSSSLTNDHLQTQEMNNLEQRRSQQPNQIHHHHHHHQFEHSERSSNRTHFDNPNQDHLHLRLSQTGIDQENMHICGHRGRRSFGNRGYHRGRGTGRHGRCRNEKRKMFRRVFARFTVFFTLTMIWLHSSAIAESLQKAYSAMPQPITTTLNIIGHILYGPLALSQTFGAFLYCAIFAILLTVMHIKLRKRKMERWQTSLREALRARVANGPQEHDHEAWPSNSHPNRSDHRVHFSTVPEETCLLDNDQETLDEDEKSSTASSSS